MTIVMPAKRLFLASVGDATASGGSREVVVSGRCHSTWLRVVDPEGLLPVGDATAPGCEWWIQRGCCQWEMPQHLVASGGSRGVVVSGRCHSTWLRVVDPAGVGDATAPGCEWWIQRGLKMPQHLVASGGSRGVVVSGRCHSTWLRVSGCCQWEMPKHPWLRVVAPERLLSVGDVTAPGCEWWIQRGCCQWEMPQHLVASGGSRGVVVSGNATAPGCEWWIQRGCCQQECHSTWLRVVDPEGLLSAGDTTAPGCQRGCCQREMPQHLAAREVVVSGRCHSTWLRVVDPEGLLSAGDATAPGCEWWIQRGCCQREMPQHLFVSGGSRGVVVSGGLRVVDPEGLLSVGDATAPGCEWWIQSGCNCWDGGKIGHCRVEN